MQDTSSTTPIFTVLITTFNSATTIQETLQYIVAQTFQEIELIIVDDGSEDETLDIIHRAVVNTTFATKVIRSRHVGRSKALNLGLKHSSGLWITICDADDIWHPQKLEITMTAIARHPKTSVFGTDCVVFSKLVKIKNLAPVTRYSTIQLSTLIRKNVIAHSSCAVDRRVLYYDESRQSQIDYEVWLRLRQAGHVINKIHQPLTYHRQHSGQNFEGKNNLIYRKNAIRLTQKYALKNGMYLLYLWLPIFYLLGFLKQLVRYNLVSRE